MYDTRFGREIDFHVSKTPDSNCTNDICIAILITHLYRFLEVYDFDLDNVAGEIVIDDDKETFNFPCKKRKLHVDTSAVEHDHDYFFNWSEYMKMKQKINELQQENSKLKLDLRKKASLLIKKNNIIRRLRANYRQRPTTSQVSVLRDPLLVELQKNKDRKLKGARYTDKMRNMALVVNYCSPKAYRQMRTFFRLPSVSTMKKWLSKIEIKDGFSENILKLLKIKSETLPEDERVVTLFLDEMAITEKVSYVANADPDYILGFPTKLPNQQGSDVKVRAKSCLTLMIKTMKSGIKQAIGYFFCSNLDGKQLGSIVKEALVKIRSAGFIPKMVVCDQNSTNRAMFTNVFQVSEDKPYFEIDGEKVYCCYDAPHLHKSIRNNLLRHNAVYNGNVCSFQHIVDLYWEDVKTHPRSVPGLKYKHIKLAQFAEMNVGLAAQTLSQSVAAGLRSYVHTGKLSADALNTAKYCEEFDQLFDIANSSTFNETKVIIVIYVAIS